MRDRERVFQRAVAELMHAIDDQQWDFWLDELHAHWEVLDQDCRIQAAETDQAWLTPTRSAEVRRSWQDLRMHKARLPSPLPLDPTRWRIREDADRHQTARAIASAVSNAHAESIRREQWLWNLKVIFVAVDELCALY
jgi:hypothetical protein